MGFIPLHCFLAQKNGSVCIGTNYRRPVANVATSMLQKHADFLAPTEHKPQKELTPPAHDTRFPLSSFFDKLKCSVSCNLAYSSKSEPILMPLNGGCEDVTSQHQLDIGPPS